MPNPNDLEIRPMLRTTTVPSMFSRLFRSRTHHPHHGYHPNLVRYPFTTRSYHLQRIHMPVGGIPSVVRLTLVSLQGIGETTKWLLHRGHVLESRLSYSAETVFAGATYIQIG